MPDVFRKKFRELSEEEEAASLLVKEEADKLHALLEMVEVKLPASDKRCMAIAKTNLEQAIMWAIKSITA